MTKKDQITFVILPLLAWVIGSILIQQVEFGFLAITYGISLFYIVIFAAVKKGQQDVAAEKDAVNLAIIIAAITALLFFIT